MIEKFIEGPTYGATRPARHGGPRVATHQVAAHRAATQTTPHTARAAGRRAPRAGGGRHAGIRARVLGLVVVIGRFWWR